MWLEGDQVPSGCCSMCRSSLERCRASRLAWPTKPSSDLVVSWGQFERPTPVHTKHLDFGFSSMIWDMFLYFSFSFWIFVISWVQGSIQFCFFFQSTNQTLEAAPWSPCRYLSVAGRTMISSMGVLFMMCTARRCETGLPRLRCSGSPRWVAVFFVDIKSYILLVNSWAFFQDLFLLVNVL